MADRGKTETNRLKQNVEDQLNRLLQQLEDLKSEKDNMDESEYNEMWNDTMQQLKEFQASLKKMMAGDMTLVDSLSNVQLVWKLKIMLPIIRTIFILILHRIFAFLELFVYFKSKFWIFRSNFTPTFSPKLTLLSIGYSSRR